jgi:hypothetical protein
MKKTKKSENYEFIVFKRIIEFYFWKAFVKVMGFITKYPPFYSFRRNRFFHYDATDFINAGDIVNNKVGNLAGWFYIIKTERDEYFLTLTGQFSKMKKKTR